MDASKRKNERKPELTLESIEASGWEAVLNLSLPENPSLHLLQAARPQILSFLDFVSRELPNPSTRALRNAINRGANRLIEITLALPDARERAEEAWDRAEATFMVEKGFTYDPYQCPSCGASEETTCVDGDIVTGSKSVPKDVLTSLSFYARLHLFQCKACGKQFYLVEIDAVDNSDVSEDWMEKYFWHNAPIEEPEEPVTMSYDGSLPNIPAKWAATYTETLEGKLTRYFLGPFVAESELNGPYGVANCAGQPEWGKARRMTIDFLQFCSFVKYKREPIPF